MAATVWGMGGLCSKRLGCSKRGSSCCAMKALVRPPTAFVLFRTSKIFLKHPPPRSLLLLSWCCSHPLLLLGFWASPSRLFWAGLIFLVFLVSHVCLLVFLLSAVFLGVGLAVVPKHLASTPAPHSQRYLLGHLPPAPLFCRRGVCPRGNVRRHGQGKAARKGRVLSSHPRRQCLSSLKQGAFVVKASGRLHRSKTVPFVVKAAARSADGGGGREAVKCDPAVPSTSRGLVATIILTSHSASLPFLDLPLHSHCPCPRHSRFPEPSLPVQGHGLSGRCTALRSSWAATRCSARCDSAAAFVTALPLPCHCLATAIADFP